MRSTRVYRVAVFHDTCNGLRREYRSYLCDYNASWPGCCLHAVLATTGREAKRKAEAECKNEHPKDTHG